jgi:hypothetical protein
MLQNSTANDYSRYFSPRQKVYLVNMSEDRNGEIYDSLSGVVTSCGMETLELMISHDGQGTHNEESGKTTYKLTSESLGSGIQILADLTGIVAGNIFQLRMHGTLEMFQRRLAPRVDISAGIYHLQGNFPLAIFKKKWKQVRDQLSKNKVLPGLVLQKTMINLSVGGIGFNNETTIRPTPFSMFFIALDETMPVCALTETAWEQREGEGLRCGFRFIHILKTDQERINNHISNIIRENGGTYQDYKRNWVLIDKMGSDVLKPA